MEITEINTNKNTIFQTGQKFLKTPKEKLKGHFKNGLTISRVKIAHPSRQESQTDVSSGMGPTFTLET